jgi:hypothetical protein
LEDHSECERTDDLAGRPAVDVYERALSKGITVEHRDPGVAKSGSAKPTRPREISFAAGDVLDVTID